MGYLGNVSSRSVGFAEQTLTVLEWMAATSCSSRLLAAKQRTHAAPPDRLVVERQVPLYFLVLTAAFTAAVGSTRDGRGRKDCKATLYELMEESTCTALGATDKRMTGYFKDLTRPDVGMLDVLDNMSYRRSIVPDNSHHNTGLRRIRAS